MATLRLGIVPAPGSGLASMARTGQLERLLVHLGHYADTFELTYFSWGEPEEETRLWRNFHEQTDARLVVARGWTLPRREVRQCAALRCMNLLATVPAMWAKLVHGTPFVMSYGADYPALARIHGRPAWKWERLRWLAFHLASRVFVPNERMYWSLRRQFPYAVLSHQPNLVDGERFQPRHMVDIWPRHVLTVGRLVTEKNLVALARIMRDIPEVYLTCVGDGPLIEPLRSLGAFCVGAQEWTTLPHWYHAADVFALPSLSEGCPKALQEAMACGLPCLVSSAVTEGGDAVLRTDDLREGLATLLTPSVAADYGARARRYAMEHYDVRTLMPQEIDAIRRVAAR